MCTLYIYSPCMSVCVNCVHVLEVLEVPLTVKLLEVLEVPLTVKLFSEAIVKSKDSGVDSWSKTGRVIFFNSSDGRGDDHKVCVCVHFYVCACLCVLVC